MSSWRIFNPKARRAAEPGAITGSGGEGTLALSPRALRQLNRLRLNASRYLKGQAVGLRPSLRRKPAFDFLEHRKYAAGDDVRFVDWKASARAEHIYVRMGEQPKEATVYLLLDCSASMAWNKPPKSQAALGLAAAIAYMALSHGDRLFVQPLTKTQQPLGPVSGKGQLTTVLKYLGGLRFQGQADFSSAVRDFSRRSAVGGLTFIISDLIDCWPDPQATLAPALEALPVPTWDVTVLHMLHPEELHPSFHGEFEMRDIETNVTANYDVTPKAVDEYRQRLQEWKGNLEMACVNASCYYTLIESSWSLDSEIIPHLRDVNIVTPL